jgi:hypothetical protein
MTTAKISIWNRPREKKFLGKEDITKSIFSCKSNRLARRSSLLHLAGQLYASKIEMSTRRHLVM